MLEFKNVSVSIGKKNILDDISVSFEKGKITTIVGPNGCGKTTLLQTLIGMGDVISGEILRCTRISSRQYFAAPSMDTG